MTIFIFKWTVILNTHHAAPHSSYTFMTMRPHVTAASSDGAGHSLKFSVRSMVLECTSMSILAAKQMLKIRSQLVLWTWSFRLLGFIWFVVIGFISVYWTGEVGNITCFTCLGNQFKKFLTLWTPRALSALQEALSI